MSSGLSAPDDLDWERQPRPWIQAIVGGRVDLGEVELAPRPWPPCPGFFGPAPGGSALRAGTVRVDASTLPVPAGAGLMVSHGSEVQVGTLLAVWRADRRSFYALGTGVVQVVPADLPVSRAPHPLTGRPQVRVEGRGGALQVMDRTHQVQAVPLEPGDAIIRQADERVAPGDLLAWRPGDRRVPPPPALVPSVAAHADAVWQRAAQGVDPAVASLVVRLAAELPVAQVIAAMDPGLYAAVAELVAAIPRAGRWLEDPAGLDLDWATVEGKRCLQPVRTMGTTVAPFALRGPEDPRRPWAKASAVRRLVAGADALEAAGVVAALHWRVGFTGGGPERDGTLGPHPSPHR